MARAGLVCGARYHQLCSATDLYITPSVQGANGVQGATGVHVDQTLHYFTLFCSRHQLHQNYNIGKIQHMLSLSRNTLYVRD